MFHVDTGVPVVFNTKSHSMSFITAMDVSIMNTPDMHESIQQIWMDIQIH